MACLHSDPWLLKASKDEPTRTQNRHRQHGEIAISTNKSCSYRISSVERWDTSETQTSDEPQIFTRRACGCATKTHYPRNGGWTGVSVRFCGFLARPHLATATRQPARCKQEQHRQGVAKTYHRTRRALTQKVNNLNPQNINEYAVFQTMSNGQLRFLGLFKSQKIL